MTVGVLLVEVVGGILAHSLALVADAAHMFADVAALTLAWAGMALGERAPTGRHTFGLGRAEVLAAFVNAQMLLVASLLIVWEAWQRFRAPGEIHTGLMLAVAAFGLVANLGAARLLHAGRHGSLSMRAAYLEVFTDALASFGVVVAALIMARTRWYGLDALLSAVIAVVILPRGFGILRDAAHILLEGAPAEIDIPRLRAALLAVPGVEAIHDVHFWTLTSGQHSASVHIRALPAARGTRFSEASSACSTTKAASITRRSRSSRATRRSATSLPTTPERCRRRRTSSTTSRRAIRSATSSSACPTA